MGWLFRNDPSFGKKEIIARVRGESGDSFWSEGVKILATSVVGNHVWQVVQADGEAKIIALTLIQSGGPGSGWGYKSMDESAGPCHYDCPLYLLEMADAPVNDNAAEWREGVRKAHSEKLATQKLAEGSYVTYAGKLFRLRSKRRMGWNAVCLDDGVLYRLPRGYKAASAPASTGA